MNATDNSGPTDPLIDQAASEWVWRCDRGLTAAEQDELSAWLAADPRHGPALARLRRRWARCDLLTEWRREHAAEPNPDLLAPPRPRRTRWAFALPYLAAAAALAMGVHYFALVRVPERVPAAPAVARSGPLVRTLSDGTIVQLNAGTILEERFSPGERRVALNGGEAHFSVYKDPSRPFVVAVHGVEARAIGTAFNVRTSVSAVEILVTEGCVAFHDRRLPTAAPASEPAVLLPRQRAVFALFTPAPPQIAALTVGEIERVLGWRRCWLDFEAAPLAAVVAEFNRRNVVQLRIEDPALADLQLSASLRSDNLGGFVALLEAGFGIQATRPDETNIWLRRAP